MKTDYRALALLTCAVAASGAWLFTPDAPAQMQVSAAAASMLKISRLDVFEAQSQRFTLSAAPCASCVVQVFLNGLLMLDGVDYTLVGTALTFTGQTVEADPVIQVAYWIGL